MSAPRLRLLVDVSLGLTLESWIRKSGHDAVFVRDVDPRLSDPRSCSEPNRKTVSSLRWTRISASWYSARNILTAVCCF